MHGPFSRLDRQVEWGNKSVWDASKNMKKSWHDETWSKDTIHVILSVIWPLTPLLHGDMMWRHHDIMSSYDHAFVEDHLDIIIPAWHNDVDMLRHRQETTSPSKVIMTSYQNNHGLLDFMTSWHHDTTHLVEAHLVLDVLERRVPEHFLQVEQNSLENFSSKIEKNWRARSHVLNVTDDVRMWGSKGTDPLLRCSRIVQPMSVNSRLTNLMI